MKNTCTFNTYYVFIESELKKINSYDNELHLIKKSIYIYRMLTHMFTHTKPIVLN